MHDARIDALARQLVRYSTALKKGDKVLIDLHDVPDSIGLALIRETRARGPTPQCPHPCMRRWIARRRARY